jgi:hypothetical protein
MVERAPDMWRSTVRNSHPDRESLVFLDIEGGMLLRGVWEKPGGNL